ncbi:dihydroxyacetone kinase subunit DhaL [Tropicimonas sp. IMCC34043]|uniref:dihydroxyacetone kinase subunit DhaL n=1 Tax=Tropicimonas sp. IMCC34043 TaxID=2248760 RepID=UPI000E225245|nr:dihydroxyacetone kinase subunit DhaL [Tropicimonas sp. IMCC34043]
MTSFPNTGSGAMVRKVAQIVVENRGYLSEIDGKIGDGDHGNNMAKGFGRAAERIADDDTLDASFAILADVLMGEIGGSMGPLYGMFFSDMGDVVAGKDRIDALTFAAMLDAGCEGVMAIGSAKAGDKCLLDALVPAVAAAKANASLGFPAVLDAVRKAAAEGRDATKDMVAKIGRASRLGERSRGVLDAGATSCCLILTALADGIEPRLG